MATRKQTIDDSDIFSNARKEIAAEKALPLIAVKCWVVEVRDAYYNSDDYRIERWSSAVSPAFDSRYVRDPRAEAEKWISQHDPDTFLPGGAEPNYFVIETRYLRTHVEDKWGYL